MTNSYYQVSVRSLLYPLSGTLMFLFIPPIVLIIALLGGKRFDFTVYFVIQGAILPFIIPGTILLVNYYKKNAGQRILFKENEDLFLIINDNGSEMSHNRSDLVKIISVQSSANSAPWTSFEYSILLKKDGSKIFISNILVDTYDIKDLFKSVPVEKMEEWIPIIP